MSTNLILNSPANLTTPRPADRNPVSVYLARLAPSSRRPMLGALGNLAALLKAQDPAALSRADREALAMATDWEALRFQHTMLLRSELADRCALATANRHLSALRGVLEAAFDLGLMDAETYTRAAKVQNLKGTTLPSGRAISRGELRALLDACAADPTLRGARDAALLAVLYACGLRRAELVNLNREDYDRAGGEIKVRRGKGRKDRAVPLESEGVIAALDDWLAVRGDEAGPLFYPVRKGGQLQTRRLTPQAVLTILNGRAAEAGVEAVSPHDFRRSFVGDLLDAGADIATVAALAGHATIETTRRYDRRPAAVRRKAAALLHVPYRRQAKDRTVEPPPQPARDHDRGA